MKHYSKGGLYVQKGKKWRSLLLAGALLTSLLTPVAGASAATTDKDLKNFDTERYGDVISIDPYLDKLSKDADFNAKLKKDFKRKLMKHKQKQHRIMTVILRMTVERKNS